MPRGQHPNSRRNLKPAFNSETAREAGKKSAESKKAKKPIRELARMVGDTRVTSNKLKKQLADMGVPENELTNNALIMAAVFQAAVHGDMKAIEKWERYIGQEDKGADAKNGQLADLIDGLKEPIDNDLYTEATSADGAVADE